MREGDRLRPWFPAGREALVLAPMQDVTDLAFWRIMARYGGADLYVTEYFRVYPGSVPERHIAKSLEENPTSRPAIAQMIGQDIPALCRTAEKLQQFPVVGIDLNLGCPAPIVCRKQAGGGLLPHPERIDAILGALRACIGCAFTVKTRIGFASGEEFAALLEVFARHALDGLTVHGRTVKQMYRPPVDLEAIREAVARMPCPVIANGNVLSVAGAARMREMTGAAGFMMGRGAIRNPWLFAQIREWQTTGEVRTRPTLRQLRAYIDELYQETSPPGLPETKRVAKIKKYLNFVAQRIPGAEGFPEAMRRATSERELFAVCDAALDREGMLPDLSVEESLVATGQREGCHG